METNDNEETVSNLGRSCSLTSNNNNSNIITLNISGRRFQTTPTTLSGFPGTQLSRLSPANEAYIASSNEYFFDRNPAIFDSILDAYRTGRLHIPPNICPFFVQEELEFWGIKDTAISPCCWPDYGHHLYERERVETISKNLHHNLSWETPVIDQSNMTPMNKWKLWRWKTWVFFEDPTSSQLAQAWGVFYLFMVLLSVALQCLMTHPYFRFPADIHIRNVTNETNPKIIMYATTLPFPALEYMDDCCLGVFLVELVVRLTVCPDYFAFISSIYNIIDIACVVPMLVSVVVSNAIPNFLEDDALFAFVFFLAFLGVFRIFRLIKFSRNFMGMRVMLLALQASIKEILLLFLLISMGMLLFSTLVYYAEFYTEDEFLNIPIGFWWAIVTMTTVGYGDITPKSGWGYLVGSLCALSGMLCTGLPIPIIANNFNLFYAHARGHRVMKDTDEDRRQSIRKKLSKGCLNIRVCQQGTIENNLQNGHTNPNMQDDNTNPSIRTVECPS